ncbi:MAG: hypothetical protein ACR2PS_05195 [Pseudomonadales bacterium]
MNTTIYRLVILNIILLAGVASQPAAIAQDGSSDTTQFDGEGRNENLLAGNFIFKTNVLLLLRQGQTEQAAAFLEESLSDELEVIANARESNLRTVALYNAGLVDQSAEHKLFLDEELLSHIEIAHLAAAKAQSKTCHKTTTCKLGAWCFGIPWSLRPIDVDSTGIWRYVIGSGCGFTLKANFCGQPVTGSVCLD